MDYGPGSTPDGHVSTQDGHRSIPDRPGCTPDGLRSWGLVLGGWKRVGVILGVGVIESWAWALGSLTTPLFILTLAP